MGQIVIEGSVTPCIELPRGERAEVEHTDHVQRLIDRGYVTVVDEPTPQSEAPDPGPKRRRAREPEERTEGS